MMPGHTIREPHPPAIEDPEELEPGMLPVEPDEGYVPSHIPEDPERDRMVDPEDCDASYAGGRQIPQANWLGLAQPTVLAMHDSGNASDWCWRSP
jgi:hypothetical protein